MHPRPWFVAFGALMLVALILGTILFVLVVRVILRAGWTGLALMNAYAPTPPLPPPPATATRSRQGAAGIPGSWPPVLTEVPASSRSSTSAAVEHPYSGGQLGRDAQQVSAAVPSCWASSRP